ncbi:histidine phosphatase family protein [Niallia oryzisoli]|uniref:Histidine phosphatase family protein n=1 Tax=Niallia oryzisoli TaxID=1737571 RepID=A0ABZ2CB15_9BACI
MKNRLFIAFMFVIIICLTTFINPIYAENVTINNKEVVNQNEPGTVTIYLVRHGKTILNQNDRAQGWADGPLTPSGEDLVIGVGRGLADVSFVAAYSSDSGRAIQTAKLILTENHTKAKGLQPIENKGIREVYFGEFEGEKMSVLWRLAADHMQMGNEGEFFKKSDNPYKVLINTLSCLDKSGEAESYQELTDRAYKGFKEIAEQAYQNGGGDILVVSHGITINAILEKIDANKVSGEIVKNGSVSKLTFDGTGWRIQEVNEMKYAE